MNDFIEKLHALYPTLGAEGIEREYPNVTVYHRTDPEEIKTIGPYWFVVTTEPEIK